MPNHITRRPDFSHRCPTIFPSSEDKVRWVCILCGPGVLESPGANAMRKICHKGPIACVCTAPCLVNSGNRYRPDTHTWVRGNFTRASAGAEITKAVKDVVAVHRQSLDGMGEEDDGKVVSVSSPQNSSMRSLRISTGYEPDVCRRKLSMR